MPAARASSPRGPVEDRLGLDDVVLDPSGHADDLVDPSYARAGRGRGARRGRRWLATVGTTKRAEMFSPGQQRQRAHLDQRLARGVGVQRAHARQPAVEREEQVEALLGPHLADDDPRWVASAGLSLTRSRSRISPVPSRLACRVCIATQSGCGKRSSKTSSQLTTRSPPGIARGQAVQERGLAGLGAAGDEDVQPGADRGLEERGGLVGSAMPSSTSSWRRAAREDELADVDRGPVPRRDPGDARRAGGDPSGSMASTKGSTEVDPAAAALEHPLDQLLRPASAVRIRLVSSCRPRRATKTRLGSLIQISSTVGSSR